LITVLAHHKGHRPAHAGPRAAHASARLRRSLLTPRQSPLPHAPLLPPPPASAPCARLPTPHESRTARHATLASAVRALPCLATTCPRRHGAHAGQGSENAR